MDYADIDKEYLRSINSRSVADLKKNFKDGNSTHWTFHNRKHDAFTKTQLTSGKFDPTAFKAQE